MIKIDHTLLDKDTLTSIIEEYVTRSGDNDDLDEKVKLVKKLVEAGDMTMVYDKESETVNLVAREFIEKAHM